jgi:regulator of sigma E protease
MGSALTDLLSFVVAISLLVAIHEYGHYIVGRWAGMKILRFSIGFGKPIWLWRSGKDNTEYCIASIPLGGYVRFLDSREGSVEPEDEGRAFDQRPIPARIAVLAAGPLFNFLFAIVAYWALFMPGVMVLKPAIGDVIPDSYADRAGLQFGDKIVQGGHRRTTIDVGGDGTRLTEPGALFDGLGFGVWQPPAVVGSLAPGGSAERAGIRVGDRITVIDGENVRSWSDLVGVVRDRPGQPVEVEYVRNGYAATVKLTLDADGSGEERRGLIGIGLSETSADYYARRAYTPLESLSAAVDKTWTSTLFTMRMLGRMVTGDVSFKNISGPINIAQFAGDSAERGFSYFLGFLAIISISLGVLNLLPIPVLDGGQIVYQVVEMIKGGPLTERAQILGQQIGILALLLLMSFAFYNDIARILG